VDRSAGSLLAISDLHVAYAENREFVAGLRPESDADWLLVAGDVAEKVADVEDTLARLRERFATVVWAPGNHELWTPKADPVTLRGEERYRHLVERCRAVDVVTPEDPYPVWTGPGGPCAVAPLFLLYDYTFRPDGVDQATALANAYAAGVVCRDEMLLHPDPYPTREAWCRARVEETERRLAALDDGLPTVLVNHFPLVEDPTRILRYPVFAQWCGTRLTADWPVRFRARAVVYGHLHIPRTTSHDGVPHHEVSVGYPREWRRRASGPRGPRRVLPA
jgi:3',5'-cyclic AMP phosphodiesterase CpdA